VNHQALDYPSIHPESAVPYAGNSYAWSGVEHVRKEHSAAVLLNADFVGYLAVR
jgi:hypothetical protein